MYSGLATWDLLLKEMTWKQLGAITDKKIFDFGSGIGVNANYYAENNEVVAVEPNGSLIENRLTYFPYHQIQGSCKELQEQEDNSFDIILCHNVFEYISRHTPILMEFSRLLKPKGKLSVVKHNRNGRIMQMVVLLNNFSHATELLNGSDGHSAQYGDIQYYDETVLLQLEKFTLEAKYGIRTFWHLQQNQECQSQQMWQKQMLEMEQRVSQIEDFMNIAMFHHFILIKPEGMM